MSKNKSDEDNQIGTLKAAAMIGLADSTFTKIAREIKLPRHDTGRTGFTYDRRDIEILRSVYKKYTKKGYARVPWQAYVSAIVNAITQRSSQDPTLQQRLTPKPKLTAAKSKPTKAKAKATKTKPADPLTSGLMDVRQPSGVSMHVKPAPPFVAPKTTKQSHEADVARTSTRTPDAYAGYLIIVDGRSAIMKNLADISSCVAQFPHAQIFKPVKFTTKIEVVIAEDK